MRPLRCLESGISSDASVASVQYVDRSTDGGRSIGELEASRGCQEGAPVADGGLTSRRPLLTGHWSHGQVAGLVQLSAHDPSQGQIPTSFRNPPDDL
jgi:hypothetical protein